MFLFWRLALAQLLISYRNVKLQSTLTLHKCTYRRYLGYHKDSLVPLPPAVVAGNNPVITGTGVQPNALSDGPHTLLAPSPSKFRCSDALTRLPTPSQTIINFPLSLARSPTPTSPHLTSPHSTSPPILFLFLSPRSKSL